MAVQGGEDVYVTLLTNDTYLPGALVLAHSLRDAGTTKKLAVMVTLDTVSSSVVTQLQTVFDQIIPVPRIQNEHPANLNLMNRPDLHSAFTKINLWKQTQFRRIVYIDADVVAYRAPDELFDLSHAFAAAPDIGWPDLFNTGVMALTPNLGDYYALLAMAERGISFDGADQGLLNMHFQNRYHRLSFTYNVTPSAHYQYVPAYRHFQSSINMVHFIGTDKPWFQGRNASTGSSPFNDMVGRWWSVYDRHYRANALAASEATPRQPTDLVQYFVKGEYQPRASSSVPFGERPPSAAESSSQGQQTQTQQLHFEHQSGDFVERQVPAIPHHHHHHQDYHHEHHEHHDHFEHHEHHEHKPPPPSEQSQQAAPPPQSEPSFPASSVSFRAIQGPPAEARTEQVSEHQQWAPLPSHHQEHKPEPPKQPPMQPSWDAQRHPPPVDSQPEAMNFPQMHYEMSSDAAHFVPPERYPSPPRNMYYEVPKAPPAPTRQNPPQIFPWESHRPRASRVFAKDEIPPEVVGSDESRTESPGQSRTPFGSHAPAEPSMTGDSSQNRGSAQTTPTTPVTATESWASYTRTNAWDEVPEIERYVDSWQQRHRRTRSSGGSAAGLRLGGLGLRPEDQDELEDGFRSHGSKVTDFPSEVERPSLPVTPAPIRRPRFWGGGGPGFGDDGDDDDQLLPAAEGVPRQTDWDPVAQLQKLAKQQSEMLLQKLGGGSGVEDGGDAKREIPSRSLPLGSEDAKSPTYVAQSAVLSPRPVKPGSSNSPVVRSLLGGEEESTPRSAGEMRDTAEIEIAQPSFTGPGTMFEKGEEQPLRSVRAALPTEEERDVLET